jgi:hypothetical protein
MASIPAKIAFRRRIVFDLLPLGRHRQYLLATDP